MTKRQWSNVDPVYMYGNARNCMWMLALTIDQPERNTTATNSLVSIWKMFFCDFTSVIPKTLTNKLRV